MIPALANDGAHICWPGTSQRHGKKAMPYACAANRIPTVFGSAKTSRGSASCFAACTVTAMRCIFCATLHGCVLWRRTWWLRCPPRWCRLPRASMASTMLLPGMTAAHAHGTFKLKSWKCHIFFEPYRASCQIATRYLRLPLDVERQAATAMASPCGPRAGLVWAAGEWNPGRSVPLPLLQPLLESPGCEFWSLQGGSAARQLPHNLRDANICGEGILALAAAISQLDLVITVDTLAAHLAGALGKPVWLLLAQNADWRWMTGRSDSPWYPSMRLFRQTSPGNWESPLGSIRSELTKLAEKCWRGLWAEQNAG